VITPVHAGHEELLRSHLRGLSTGAGSPLASLSTVHFARWVVFNPPLDVDETGAAGARRSYLLFDICFDDTLDALLESMRTTMNDVVDAVWQHCDGFPGCSDGHEFSAYFRRHRLDANIFLAAYSDATVEDVRTSLELRRRLIDFAVATQGLDAPTLRAAYLDAFTRDAEALAPTAARS
jgi:hypothetical protein